MRSTLALVLAAVFALVIAPAASAQTSIRLKAKAAVVPGAAVTLGDIATVTGPDSDRLSKMVVLPASSGTGDIDVPTVRSALDTARVNWGQITLGGLRCTLSVKDAPTESKPTGPESKMNKQAVPEAVDMSQPSSVRAMVAQRLAALFDTSLDRLRVKFPSGQADSAILDREVQPGERVEVQMGASASTGRVPVTVTILSDAKLITSGKLSFDVLVQRECVTTTAPLERDEAITAEMLVMQTAWLAPSTSKPLTYDEAVGRLAAKRLPAGEVLDANDVKSLVLVRKGEEVTVHCFVGTISLKSRAYALADAKLNETVLLSLDKTKTRQPFSAQVTGRNEATRISTSTPTADTAAADAALKLEEANRKTDHKREMGGRDKRR